MATINNEKVYRDYDVITYAQNLNREFYVTDTVQLQKDGGEVKQTVYQFSDLYPVPATDEIVTDNDRIEIEKRAYARAVRALKEQRPEEVFQFTTTALPENLNVGDKVRFLYDKYETTLDECGNKEEHSILHIDTMMYLTEIDYSFDSMLNESATITLDKELRINNFDGPILELQKKKDEEDEDEEAPPAPAPVPPKVGLDTW